jgi:hypothetical protein
MAGLRTQIEVLEQELQSPELLPRLVAVAAKPERAALLKLNFPTSCISRSAIATLVCAQKTESPPQKLQLLFVLKDGISAAETAWPKKSFASKGAVVGLVATAGLARAGTL